jgi:hypothetical protein
MTSLALGHMWFPWATHGMFIGQRRMFLGVQIDDWYGKDTRLPFLFLLFVTLCVSVISKADTKEPFWLSVPIIMLSSIYP